jgi:hypothetical protein
MSLQVQMNRGQERREGHGVCVARKTTAFLRPHSERRAFLLRQLLQLCTRLRPSEPRCRHEAAHLGLHGRQHFCVQVENIPYTRFVSCSLRLPFVLVVFRPLEFVGICSAQQMIQSIQFNHQSFRYRCPVQPHKVPALGLCVLCAREPQSFVPPVVHCVHQTWLTHRRLAHMRTIHTIHTTARREPAHLAEQPPHVRDLGHARSIRLFYIQKHE